MRKAYSTLLLLALAVVGFAAPVSQRAAALKAQRFLVRHGLSKASSPAPKAQGRPSAQGEGAPYYVFPGDKGFVVVSGDDRTADILAYSLDRSYDSIAMPPAMREMLEGYAREIKYLQENNVQLRAASQEAPTASPVQPLLSSAWGQDWPYNNLCPTINYSGREVQTVVGCVATAMAQILYYYRYPQQTARPIPAYTTDTYGISLDELPVATFDWAHMADYCTRNSPQATQDAVATLSSYCGRSVEMDYGPQSGANVFNIPEVLQTYFGYSATGRYLDRSDYTIRDWQQLMVNELEAGRPILYTGYSIGGGHAFVCDGFDGKGLFHINWGWNGYYQDYFRLSVLNPNTTTATGSSDIPDGFTLMQSAIVGIQPPTSEETALPSFGMRQDLSLGGSTLTYSIFNRGRNNATGVEYGLGIVNAARNITPINATAGDLQGWHPLYYQYSLSATDFPADGSWRVWPIAKASALADWQTVGTHYAVCDLANGSLTVTLHPTVTLTGGNLRFVGKPTTEGYNHVQLDIDNPGDEYNGFLMVYASTDSTTLSGEPVGYLTAAIEESSRQTVDLWFTLPTLSDLTLWVTAQPSYYGESHLVAKRTFANNRLAIASSEVEDGDSLHLTVTLRNDGSEAYNDEVLGTLYMKSGQRRATARKQVAIPAGGTATLTYSIRVPINGGYYMDFQQRTNGLSAAFNSFGRVELEGEATGIGEIAAGHRQQEAYYDLTGRKTNAPRKGIYIHNGKKSAAR